MTGSSRTRLGALVAILLITAGLRVAMLDRGAYAYPDELRHGNSLRAASHLLEGRFAAACHEVSATDARPGDAVLQLLPALAQRLTGGPRVAVDPASRTVLIPLLFQLAVSLGLVVLVYRLAQVFLDGRTEPAAVGSLASLAALVFALLGNSNAYVRHILPYDTSLLLFLGALWVAVSPRYDGGTRAALTCGLLAGAGFTVYPGYYLFPLIVFAGLLARGWAIDTGAATTEAGVRSGRTPSPRVGVLRRGALAGVGAAVAPLLFELVARIGGRSYLVDLRALSGTINQGSFEEGFSFLFKYMLQLEAPVGPLLLALAAVGWALRVRPATRERRRAAPVDLLVAVSAAAGLCFVYHAFASTVQHKMVFYGRLVHMYVPFIVWCAVAALAAIPSRRARGAASVTLALASLITFALFAGSYYPLAYPDDVLRTEADRIAGYAVTNVHVVQESHSDPRYGDPTAQVRSLVRSRPTTVNRRLVLLNFGFFYPLLPDDHTPYRPAAGATTLYDARHWLTHPVYAFEGNTIEERRLLRQRAYRVSLIDEPLE